MEKLSYILLFILLLAGCKGDNPVAPVYTYQPIWSQPGYNARNTSNPYATKTIMNPVLNGVEEWTFTFQGTNFSDGSQFCVDSRGFIYYLHQDYDSPALYKFSAKGEVAWKKDSLIQWNYCGISLNSDESRIYVVAFKGQSGDKLYCIDSAGNEIWSLPNGTPCKPAIGKNGTLYLYHNSILSAVSPEGNILWQNPSILILYGVSPLALDKEDNIYTISYYHNIVKLDKYGTIIWSYNINDMSAGIVIDGYGNIYFNGWNKNTMFCLNSDGNLKWTKSNANGFSTPVITSDNKILLSKSKYITAFDTAGTELWKTQAFNTSYAVEGIMLDDFDNVYYLGDCFPIRAGSISADGINRWEYNSADMWGTLPPPVLIPQGKFLFAPKRAGKIRALN